ncbi:MAG: chitinase, partial [Bacteroidetes bacterium]|nr:chitinase [Bacteroidota bacterium]
MKRLGVAFLLLLNGTVFGADKMVLGYYPSWTSVPHSVIPWQYLTHIAHAFIGPKADGSLEVPSGLLYPALITAAHAHEVKVVVSVGGWNETYASNFSTLAADSATRRAFASNLTQFCVANGYDGADVDWEFPANTTDRANHAQMIHAIRQAFDSVQPGLTLSMAGSSGNWYGQWIDFAATKNDFDWIGIMTYDFYGDWMSVSGPNSPLNS